MKTTNEIALLVTKYVEQMGTDGLQNYVEGLLNEKVIYKGTRQKKSVLMELGLLILGIVLISFSAAIFIFIWTMSYFL